MARRTTPGPKSSTQLSMGEKQTAIARLESRIKELRELSVSGLADGNDPSVTDLEARIRSTLANVFGQDSPEYARLKVAANLDATAYTMTFDGSGTPSREIQDGVDKGRKRAISVLQGEVDALKEDLSFSGAEGVSIATPIKTPMPVSNEIFIVHGRDDAAKTEVARLVERAGLRAVILHEQANGGRTIIQKFEDHGSTAGFAIVIMTPDDVGGLDATELQPRARQNVIGEMFWFAGRLGRERVCALKKGAVEVPTDFAGVGYVDMDSIGAWKKDVLRELDHAGYKNLDWQKALA
jgi:predicted nucleotide-binding protein